MYVGIFAHLSFWLKPVVGENPIPRDPMQVHCYKTFPKIPQVLICKKKYEQLSELFANCS